MALAKKKRKYEDEERTFKPEWEGKFAFTDNGGKPLCFICHDSLSHYKASNMKRHHETRHNNYPLKSALRRSKLTELKSLLNFQKTLIKTFNNEGDRTT